MPEKDDKKDKGKSAKKAPSPAGPGALILVAILVATFLSNKKDQATPATDQTASTTAATTTPVTADADIPKNTATVYKNGTYAATGSYMSPGGADRLAVSLTLADDIITDITVTPGAGDPKSEKYQAMFISGYKQFVVGKNIADVKLSKVSGSSLTSIGFNEAIDKIKAEAKS